MFSYDSNRSVADVYDKGRHLTQDATRLWSDVIGSACTCLPTSPDFILDLGCGTGRFTSLLSDKFLDSSIVGIDPSSSMLDKAISKKYSSPVSFLYGSAESLPLDSYSIDVVFMSMVYHHIFDKSSAISEIFRVLKNRESH